MSVLVQSTLTNPFNQPIPDATIRITAEVSTGDTPKAAEAVHITTGSGDYSFTLVEGRYTLEVMVDDEYIITGSAIVDAFTPSPLSITQLVQYSTPVQAPVVVPEDANWEDLHDDLRTDVDTLTRSNISQISDTDVLVNESKHLTQNDRIDAVMAEEVVTTQSKTTEVTQQVNTYEDGVNNQSIQIATEGVTGTGQISHSTELYEASNGKVDIHTKKELTTPSGTITERTDLDDTELVNSQSLDWNGNAASVNATIDAEGITRDTALNHGNVTGTRYEELNSTYRDDDNIEVNASKVSIGSNVQLEEGIHNAEVYENQTALVDKDDQLQTSQERGIVAYLKKAFQRITNTGVLSRMTTQVDEYVIQGHDEEKLVTFDTVNKTLSINGSLSVNNAADFRGADGTTQFQVFQYSDDNASWHDDWVSGDIYRRWNDSIDGYVNPSNWSEGTLLIAKDGEDGDTTYVDYRYSDDQVNWHATFVDGDIWRQERTILNGTPTTNWTPTNGARIKGSDGADGEITAIAYQYSVDGFDPWHSNFSTGDHYRRERVEYFYTVADKAAGAPYQVEGWSSAAQMVPKKGFDYFDGLNQTIVYLYQRIVAGTPVEPTGVLTYDFAQKTITGGDLEGWSLSIPDGVGYIWVTVATASSMNNTDDIAANEWVTPEVMGSSPYNHTTVNLYKRTMVQPAAPTTTLTYDFVTKVLGGDLEGWVVGAPPTGNEDLYMATASVVDQYTNADIDSGDWAVGLLLQGSFKQQTVQVYLRSPSEPVAPQADVTYDFTTGSLTGLTGGWTTAMPTGVDDVYVAVAIASGITDTDVIPTANWAVGLLGASGYQVVPLTLYNDSVDLPAVPSNAAVYDFTARNFTTFPDNGWTRDFPVNTTGKIWVTTGSANGSALATEDTIPTSEWAIPEVFMESGMQVGTVTLYRIAAEVLDDTDLPTQDLTYSFVTGKLTDTPDNEWSTIPLSNDTVAPVWITTASISTLTINPTDIIPVAEWTTPTVQVRNGSTEYDIYEYSVDGVSGWHVEFGDDDIYRRTARYQDGTVGDWSVAKIGGIDGADGDTLYFSYLYSADLIDWHDPMEEGDIYRKETLVTNGVYGEYSDPVRLKGESDIIEYQYSINSNGFNWHSNFSTGDYYRRERSVVDGVAGAWSEAAQIVPKKDVDYSDGTSAINVFEIYEYSVDGVNDWHPEFVDEDMYRKTAVIIAGVQSDWSEPSLITGSAILVRLTSDEGFFFKNNSGNAKAITAEVWINGDLSTDYSPYNFHWKVGTDTVYTTANGDYVGLSPAGGIYPANGEAENGMNFQTINVDFTDVVDGQNLNLTCEITNI
jgi:hypothetical protein